MDKYVEAVAKKIEAKIKKIHKCKTPCTLTLSTGQTVQKVELLGDQDKKHIIKPLIKRYLCLIKVSGEPAGEIKDIIDHYYPPFSPSAAW